MTQIEDELQSLEGTLKKCAEELGTLNVDNNRLQELNQNLEQEIKKLQIKINKRTHSIEQEQKDKQIIHQKLLKAERIKEQLEIKHQKIKAKRQQQQLRAQIKQQKRQTLQKQQRINNQQLQNSTKINQKYSTTDSKDQHKKEDNSNLSKSNIKKEDKLAFNIDKTKEAKKNTESLYKNQQKGEYEPPALFFDDNDSESDSEEDNSNVLQKLKQKLKQDRQQIEQDDD